MENIDLLAPLDFSGFWALLQVFSATNYHSEKPRPFLSIYSNGIFLFL